MSFRDTRENFFDRASILLEKRKKFHNRKNDPKHGPEYCYELRRIFYAKLKAKRWTGLALEAKTFRIVAVVALIATIVFWLQHRNIHALVCLVATAISIWNHVTALTRLCPILAEADREAAAIVHERHPGKKPKKIEPEAPAADNPEPARPVTQQDLLRRAARPPKKSS